MSLKNGGIIPSKPDRPGIPAGQKPKAPRPKKKLKPAAKEFQDPSKRK